MTITTASGRSLDVQHLRADQVHLEDVAHALAMQCRFMGHCKRFYSVAEHSLLVSLIAARAGCGPDVVRAALLHDAHEAYVCDLPKPIKATLPDYEDLELRAELAVRARFHVGIHPYAWDRVKTYDRLALLVEALSLFEPAPNWVYGSEWSSAEELREAQALVVHDVVPVGMWPEVAKRAFLERASELGIG